MPRNRRSSSYSSGSLSPDERSSKTRYRSSKKRESSSSSGRSSSRRRRTKDTSSSRRSKGYKRSRKHRSDSSSRSSERSRSYRRTKSNKKDKHRSSSSSSSTSASSSSSKKKTSRLIDLTMEREKNYEFNDGINDLYKNEQSRRNLITKLDDGGGFKPKSFKSSRSTQQASNSNPKPKLSKEQEHENAIFGPVSSNNNFSKDLSIVELNTINPAVEFNVISSNSKSLMHESLFEEVSIKEKRWKLKLLDLIKTNSF